MTDLSVSDYSEKAIVVRGEDTKSYTQQLGALGGKYNDRLRGGPGWIFSKKMEDKVLAFVSSGKVEKERDDTSCESPNCRVLLEQLEKAFSNVSYEQRLDLVAKIAVIAAKPVVKPAAKPVVRSVVVKPVSKPARQFAKPAATVTSDCEESDDEPVARPRLLRQD
jgi:hypothetical protein